MGFGSPVIPAKAPTSSSGESPHVVIPAKAPNVVIPAKAGIQLLAFSSRCASRNPPTSLCFFTRHPWRASHFLLLAQEKVTKEKGTPEDAVGR